MLDYDLIGFQTEEWLESFRHYVERELGGTVERRRHRPRRQAQGEGRPPSRSASTSASSHEADERADATRGAIERLKRSAEGKQVIIGVDRLDYSKGLEERFWGYRRFLEEHPDCHGNVLPAADRAAAPRRGPYL